MKGNPRYYHGTASAFERVEPEKLALDALYGPGYYLTDSPVVAASYARERGEDVDVAELERFAERFRKQAARWELALMREKPPPGSAAYKDYTRRMKEDLAEVARWEKKIEEAGRSGPNIRVVDVPDDLLLLDMDEIVSERLLGKIRRFLERESDYLLDRYEQYVPDQPTGHQVFRALERAGEDREYPVLVLNQLGFDGVRYEGGKRMPLRDSQGRAVLHDVRVVFPQSLHKIRNVYGRRPEGMPGGAP